MILLFWLLLSLIIYCYFGYPLILAGLGCIFKKPVDKGKFFPFVSIIIPAYNEEASINSKLENVLSLKYPQDKFEVIVASDCSTDRTDDIVRANIQKGILLCRSKKRGGKVTAYKNAIGMAKGDIVVFSDATSVLEENSLVNLVRNFNDPKVGCVAGLLTYEDPQTVNVGKGEHGYWQYNRNINMLEGSLDSMTSVSGTFFAVRKRLYPLNIENHLAEDLVVPLNVRRNGFVTVMEPEALCFESPVQTQAQEIRKRSRITIQNLHGLLSNLDMFNFFKYGLFSVFLISHKSLRALSALFLLGLFVLNLFLLRHSGIYMLTFIGQIIFYALGILGGMWSDNRPKIINAVYFFCLSNYSILIGFFMFLAGHKVITWETERQEL